MGSQPSEKQVYQAPSPWTPGNLIFRISDKQTNLLMGGNKVWAQKPRKENAQLLKSPFLSRGHRFYLLADKEEESGINSIWKRTQYFNHMFQMWRSLTGNQNHGIWQKGGGKTRSKNPRDSGRESKQPNIRCLWA